MFLHTCIMQNLNNYVNKYYISFLNKTPICSHTHGYNIN